MQARMSSGASSPEHPLGVPPPACPDSSVVLGLCVGSYRHQKVPSPSKAPSAVFQFFSPPNLCDLQEAGTFNIDSLTTDSRFLTRPSFFCASSVLRIAAAPPSLLPHSLVSFLHLHAHGNVFQRCHIAYLVFGYRAFIYRSHLQIGYIPDLHPTAVSTTSLQLLAPATLILSSMATPRDTPRDYSVSNVASDEPTRSSSLGGVLKVARATF